MDEQFILALTRVHFPDFPETGVAVKELHGGGSDRRYFRVVNGTHSIIFSQYGTEREENALFAAQTDFLARHHVSVPRILARDPANCRLWIEDLGATDLWSFRNADWETVRRPLYEATLREVAKIHALREANLTDAPVASMPPFDESLYLWEQNYFLKHFAANFSAAAPQAIEEMGECRELRDLRLELAAQPRCLVHRDFQSQNVLIRDGQPVFIDYQGLRYGLGEYDVASIIYDPYVEFTPAQRDELIAYAETLRPHPRFLVQFHQCAVQRLMQALGAYGFLSLVKGKRAFLQHIRPAIKNLREVAIERGAMPVLEPLLSLREFNDRAEPTP